MKMPAFTHGQSPWCSAKADRYFLNYFQKQKKANIWRLIILTVVLTFFAYPACFSTDIFDYIFKARIFVFYGKSPWIFSALDFPSDRWALFMHWPKTTFQYGPAWFMLTIPFYFFGFHKLVLTLFSFKLLMALSFIGCLILIAKISEKLNQPKNLSLAFFAFNPLIIIESLVNPHIDITLTFFTLWSFYFLFGKKKVKSLVLLLLSVATKFITLVLFPIILLRDYLNLSNKDIIKVSLILIYSTTIFVIFKKSINPWYFILPFSLSALIPQNPVFKFFTWSLSISALVRYLPFLFMGYFDPSNKIRLHLFLTFMMPFAIWYLRRILLKSKRGRILDVILDFFN